jgi:NAD(P)-dependent dehydrogenase (short-subunit alcohol dehydrogenase family)
MGKLEGKVAIITGASRGIGAAAGLKFAAEGARVVLAARSGGAIETLAAEIRGLGGEALAVETDLSQEESVKRLVEAAVAEFGRLDVAFNNAGEGQMPQPLADLPADWFDRAIAANLRSVFLSMKHEIPAMLATGGGAIVNMSSTAGVSVAQGIAAYAAAKMRWPPLRRGCAPTSPRSSPAQCCRSTEAGSRVRASWAPSRPGAASPPNHRRPH